MRFGLQDVKRQVRRREGELALTLHFLRAGELREEIARLVVYHERHCGQARKSFSQDEASALVGDYRLANCFLATLSAWYLWQSPAWEETVETMGEQARAALDEAGVYSPLALRLALFDYVHEHYAGFLDARARPVALESFAALYGLDAARLETLLALDSEEEARLVRVSAAPPEADAVAGLYNQWVFEAALCNASEVRFSIDCAAFLEVQRTTSGGMLTGLGAVIKRLCFLARKLGVYYDLAYEEAASVGTLLHLTLYGPQEMTGSPQHYGQRLARLCRQLLGSGMASPKHSENEAKGGSAVGKRRSSAALNRALQRAEASVYLFQQPYHFSMEAELLALLPAPEQERAAGRVAETAGVYDSGIEQSFAEAFAALERAQATDGWQLEREPEPLLLPGGPGESSAGIVIPDFALTRGKRRVYIEILGFWTPSYRERKLQKLQQLRGRADLILALPIEAHQSFAALAEDYPLIEYQNQLSASEVLRVMHTRYDDFAQRLSELDIERVRTEVRAARFIPERACYALLSCYRRAELAQAAARVFVPAEIAYTPGIGLYLLAWLEHIHVSFVEWVEAKACLEWSLPLIIHECMARWPELAGCDDATIEALLALWPEVEIRRDSIFEARLLVTAFCQAPEEATPTAPAQTGTHKVVRERRPGSKKRVPPATSQQNLWE